MHTSTCAQAPWYVADWLWDHPRLKKPTDGNGAITQCEQVFSGQNGIGVDFCSYSYEKRKTKLCRLWACCTVVLLACPCWETIKSRTLHPVETSTHNRVCAHSWVYSYTVPEELHRTGLNARALVAASRQAFGGDK